MAVSIRNTSAAGAPPVAPTRADGRPYAYEMIYAGGTRRGYADEVVELVGMLIPDYTATANDDERTAARLRLALDVQVRLQAQLAVGGAMHDCTPEERSVILSRRDVPPSPARWDAPVPLVLITSFYEPVGSLARPEGPADRQIWLDPSTDWTLLTSLHAAGAIHVGARGAQSRTEESEGGT
ncbi:hypothetical protein [Actinoallomurus sp. NPDC050550]|uniref:hypothetical protein n=1 Tax=Actinoallomurus sp. NPDC050550 TaxID=3154937 RepID=UPI00340D3CF7